ncbi:F-BAR domain only protein 2 [Cichlidogyrus casuarinus]|uniref:F-BAR domain only protein 2 n=1 Tax=Cichlidogyrus casuarinus TaxID=1844966 RepID=A0ABD2PT38_9PLAT
MNIGQFLRFDLMEYWVDVNTVHPPISLCTFWRCQEQLTEFHLSYAVHWPATCPATPNSTEVLQVTLIVDGGVSKMQSKPIGTWNEDINRAVWKVPLHPPINVDSRRATDIIRARFECLNGPSVPSPVSLQFVRENCLASGMMLKWTSDGTAYPLHLMKRRLIADKYICDPPTTSNFIIK